MLYDRLDRLRAETSSELAGVLQRSEGGTHQARSERDAAAARLEKRRSELQEVENKLCFGRLDYPQETLYVGRIGLFDENDDYRPWLVDWRALAARSFYTATAAQNEGVVRRRHIRIEGRTVVGIDDEVFDFDRVDQLGDAIVGEAALLAALEAARTDRMRDIVATIQRDQDQIIRSPLGGVLVVEGGPGTGKTAVALHRVAFLLYSHRERLEKAGVLVIGPHAQFLKWIEQVLPSLGETGVLYRTVGQLYQGVDAQGRDSWEAAEIKGSLEMVNAIAAAVHDCQQVPDVFMKVVVDGYDLYLDQLTCELIRRVARVTDLPHNQARPVVERLVIEVLAHRMMQRLGEGYLDDTDFVELQAEMRQDSAVRAALDRLWPVLTPQQLLTDLFTSPARLETAMPDLSPEKRVSLLREQPADLAQDDWWTPQDVSLLDEAAELLGQYNPHLRETAEEDEALAYARGVLNIIDTGEMIDDPETLRAAHVINARQLAERHRVQPAFTAAERASADRTWTFGHVVVDEAQEISPMAWRMIMRRCPSRSITVVGDLEQGSAPARTTSWDEALSPYVGDRWRLERLNVNYRTPAEIMDLVRTILPEFSGSRSVRSTRQQPWNLHIDQDELASRLPSIVAGELSHMGEGRLAVFVPYSRHESVTSILDGETNVTIHMPDLAKGLEFDSVIVIDPERICTETLSGRTDLYVALTRSTRRLGLLHLDHSHGPSATQ